MPHNNDRYYFENMFNNALEVNIIGLVLPTSTASEVMSHVVRRPLTPYRYNPNTIKYLLPSRQIQTRTASNIQTKNFPSRIVKKRILF